MTSAAAVAVPAAAAFAGATPACAMVRDAGDRVKTPAPEASPKPAPATAR